MEETMTDCPTCKEPLDGSHCGLYCKEPEEDLLQLAKDISAQRDKWMAMCRTAQEECRKAQKIADEAIRALREHLAECKR
jgi:hypothetical protein